jgi:nucleoside-diphosphate-sugar epimerase
VARVSEFIEGNLLHRHPSVPLEAARMSTTRMAFDDTRARQELGYSPRPAADALAASAHWFVDQEKVVPARRDKVVWAG